MMQKITKMIVVLCLIFVTLFAIGGYIWMKHENDKNTFIEKQEQRITKYLKYNIPNCNAITFTDNNTVPTGDFDINGYINNNEKLGFTATVSLGGGESNFEGTIGYTDKLDKLFRKDVKTVSQIEKIEKEQKP